MASASASSSVAQGFDTGPRVSVSSAHSSQIKQAEHPPFVYSYTMPISVPPQTGHGLGSIIVAFPGARPKLAYWSCRLASAARTPAGPSRPSRGSRPPMTREPPARRAIAGRGCRPRRRRPEAGAEQPNRFHGSGAWELSRDSVRPEHSGRTYLTMPGPGYRRRGETALPPRPMRCHQAPPATCRMSPNTCALRSRADVHIAPAPASLAGQPRAVPGLARGSSA
jgi:hypothetical protein